MDNSTVYNGENDIITVNAKKVLVVVIDKLSEKEEFLMRLEKAINPLLDDNDQVFALCVTFSFETLKIYIFYLKAFVTLTICFEVCHLRNDLALLSFYIKVLPK